MDAFKLLAHAFSSFSVKSVGGQHFDAQSGRGKAQNKQTKKAGVIAGASPSCLSFYNSDGHHTAASKRSSA